MDKTEFETKNAALDLEYIQKRKELRREYIQHFPGRFSIGDFLQDLYTDVIIRVESIGIYIDAQNFPQPSYSGPRMTKQKVPFKTAKTERLIHERVMKI